MPSFCVEFALFARKIFSQYFPSTSIFMDTVAPSELRPSTVRKLRLQDHRSRLPIIFNIHRYVRRQQTSFTHPPLRDSTCTVTAQYFPSGSIFINTVTPSKLALFIHRPETAPARSQVIVTIRENRYSRCHAGKSAPVHLLFK